MKAFARYFAILVFVPCLFMNLECNNEDMPTYVEPVADFTVDKTRLAINEVVRFTDRSYDPNGTVMNWRWSFGDGTRSSLQNPTHAYAEPGSYTVELIVFDDHSQSGSKVIEIVVN